MQQQAGGGSALPAAVPAADPSLSIARVAEVLRAFFAAVSAPDVLPEFLPLQVSVGCGGRDGEICLAVSGPLDSWSTTCIRPSVCCHGRACLVQGTKSAGPYASLLACARAAKAPPQWPASSSVVVSQSSTVVSQSSAVVSQLLCSATRGMLTCSLLRVLGY